jgi:hypothetical protein
MKYLNRHSFCVSNFIITNIIVSLLTSAAGVVVNLEPILESTFEQLKIILELLTDIEID